MLRLHITNISFNTTIVWVRQSSILLFKSKIAVSIQRLFGFVNFNIHSLQSGAVFQYNDCLGSSFNGVENLYTLELFQYNDCLGSSGYSVDVNATQYRFQYNDCLGSS